MLNKVILAFFFLSTALFAEAPVECERELEIAKRVQLHLLIGDLRSALDEAKKGLEDYPDSTKLQVALFRALSEKGDEIAALSVWNQLGGREDRDLLETLAWGVLNKGEKSAQLSIRATSIMGASFTRDSRAIPILLDQLRGSNALLRSLAAQMAAHFGDLPLQMELQRMLKEEKVWYVRLQVIRSIGMLRMTHLRTSLKEIIGNTKTIAEEKAEAIIALVSMYDAIDVEELKSLVRSNRAGLRELACQIVIHLELKERIVSIHPLLKDPSPDVRTSALNAIGLVGADVPFAKIEPLLDDSSPEVAVTAAWLATLMQEPAGLEKLLEWCKNSNPEVRRLASAALASTGTMGVKRAYREMKETKDPYIQANLALGLIGQRQHTDEACSALFKVFVEEGETLWMFDSHLNPIFRSLAPSRLSHVDHIPNYPKAADQWVRLEILSILSIMHYPEALAAVKDFLKNQTWGVTGMAAATLLEEGDDEAIVLVRELLNDPNEKIRVQAALILAMVGSDTSALHILEKAYPRVDREMKIQILEAIGHIGDRQSIPFLVRIFNEPFQALRVVAASALIQCLYN